jgi:hypothetical protein
MKSLSKQITYRSTNAISERKASQLYHLTGLELAESVKIEVSRDGESVYNATARSAEIRSIPASCGDCSAPYVVQVGKLHATGPVGLVFEVDGIHQWSLSATEFCCKKGQMIVWKLVLLLELAFPE